LLALACCCHIISWDFLIKRSVRFVTPNFLIVLAVPKWAVGSWQCSGRGVVPYCEIQPCHWLLYPTGSERILPIQTFRSQKFFPKSTVNQPMLWIFRGTNDRYRWTCCLTWRWIRHCHGKLWRVPDISLEVIIRRHTLSSKYVAWGWANTREWRHTIWRGWVFWHRFMRATASKPNGEALTETRPHCKQIQKRCLGFGWNENRKERIQGAMVTITRNIQKAVEVRKCRGVTLEIVGKSWDKLDRPYVPEVSAPGPFILYAFDFLQCRSNVILLWSVW
jgi:hypothetical protein